eukprot:jgi/Picre1/34487/NNA_001955.t1
MKKAIVLALVFATTLFQSGVSAQWAFDLSEDDDLMPSKIPGRQLLQQYSPEPIPIPPAPPGHLQCPPHLHLHLRQNLIQPSQQHWIRRLSFWSFHRMSSAKVPI